MSVREGTRRKKISVLHMLGTWEGKIDGCNCPSCKEFDAGEKSLGNLAKSPTKAQKNAKAAAKKVSIKVKTTKVLVDKKGGVLETKSPQRPQALLKNKRESDEDGDAVESKLRNDGNVNLAVSDGDGPCDTKSSLKDSKDRVEEISDRNLKKRNLTQNYDDEEEEESASKEKNIDNLMDTEGFDNSEEEDVKSVKRSAVGHKMGQRNKSIRAEAMMVDPLHIKQEPEEYFSDEEEGGKYSRHSSDGTKSDARPGKRARMVTSEIENIYAKPRMIFTGKGVVRKFEPGADKTPKSRRGRKPNKGLVPVKVKQEPKDPEEEREKEGADMDQLQRALSEAAAGIGEVGDFMDDFDEELDSKAGKEDKKKRKQKWLKKVENEIDKYVECSICFKMLKESSMKQHFKTHTGEKPHTCDECDARFTRKGDVERHKRLVHKNQKPYKCRKCNREFSDRKNLKSHLQNHDKAIYYACDTCGFKFGKREYYENHIRYIHPLPNGQMPIFPEGEEDLASKQLKELEMEENKEIERERDIDEENLQLDDIDEEEEDEEEDEEDKAMEITVTEGEEPNATLRNMNVKEEDASDTNENVISKSGNQEMNDQHPSGKNSEGEVKEILASPIALQGSQVGTDVRVSKGTLSFTQTLPDTDTRDEELVNKVIAAAVSQAANTLESLQTIAGANLATIPGNEVTDFEDEEEEDDDDEEEEEEDDEEEDEEEEMVEGADAIQDILDNSNFDIVPMPQVQKAPVQQTEIHINASVGGQKKKFIIQVPPGSNFNVQTPDGMEMIVSMVNQLCPGKGELDGPIEVVMHNSNPRVAGIE